MSEKAVSVVGLGYIGLPTATVLASRGACVIGVDVNKEVVQTINRGEIHIAEPDLDIAVRSVVTTGKLSATTRPRPADAFLIAVPTPFQHNHEADLSYIEAASRSVARVLRSGNVVILESTAPVGATEKMCLWMAEERPDLSFPDTKGEKSDIRVAHCPERVLPGKILRELVENDRVIGGMTERCTEAAAAIYTIFVNGELVHTDVRTAELCKLAENAYRDVNIAFANELSLLCDRYAIDVWELIELANRHPRVNILQPGAGVGGHCIAVDPWFIISQAPDLAKVMRTARSVNDGKPRFVVEQVKRQVAGRRDAVVACLGLTFKPDVDDLRESPALRIAETLAEEGLDLIAVEPHIETLPPSLAQRPNVRLEPLEIAVEEADVLVGLVKHRALSEECRRRDLSSRDFLDYVNLLAN
jgi:UDP-N-acetyl-D-mannosaminuronic acid dehydrogenase